MLGRRLVRSTPAFTAAAALLAWGDVVFAASPAAGSAPARDKLYLLAVGGYGASTQDVRRMDLAPYGVGFGLDAGYTLESGLHLGAYFDAWLGHTTPQRRDPLIGRTFDYDADTSALNAGVRIGFDVPLYMLVLRYHLGLGITAMGWDFGGVAASDVLYGDASQPSVGIHVAPGALLLLPREAFVVGAGFDYLAQIDVTLPSGFLGKLVVGVRL